MRVVFGSHKLALAYLCKMAQRFPKVIIHSFKWNPTFKMLYSELHYLTAFFFAVMKMVCLDLENCSFTLPIGLSKSRY